MTVRKYTNKNGIKKERENSEKVRWPHQLASRAACRTAQAPSRKVYTAMLASWSTPRRDHGMSLRSRAVVAVGSAVKMRTPGRRVLRVTWRWERRSA